MKEQYEKYLYLQKQEANRKKWLYIDIVAKELLDLYEVKDIKACCEAMLSMMLEGDCFLYKPKNLYSKKLTIRYYVDKLHVSRKKYKGEEK